MSYIRDSPRGSTMHKLVLTLVVFSSSVLCNTEDTPNDTVNWMLEPSQVANSNESRATADSVPSIVSMTGHINYHAAQQVFIVNWLPDMFDKGKKSCKTDLHRADYTVTAGIGAHKLHRNMVNWNEARRTCAAEGGILAIINSKKEEKILFNLMETEMLYSTWVGIHDLFEEGDWITLTDETLEAAGYDVWEKDEPNNGSYNENCGRLISNGGLSDYSCERLLPFICEINC